MKIGIVLCSYNRAKYLVKTLEHLKKATLPANTLLVMVDDASTEQESIDLFDKFYIDGITTIKYRNAVNSKISFSLKKGFQRCFDEGCDIAINLDSDAIVKPNFVEVLVDLKKCFPQNIVTGFNSINKNRDGSSRHPIIENHEAEGYHLKSSVGGINMCISVDEFFKYLNPAFEKVLASQGNWDHMTCIASMADGLPIVVSVPSVIQHIGFESSMNHVEQPDVACDFANVYLPNVTLIGIDCKNVERLLRARDISCADIKFGAVKMLSSIDHAECIKIDALDSIEAYSEFMIKKLHEYVDTDYCLIIQHDGYVLNAEAWSNEFLKYDYIGAPWEWYQDDMKVGNGGFSLRSKKLLTAYAYDELISETHPEDHAIGRTYRRLLEKHHDIKFAPVELARQFSIEAYRVAAPDDVWRFQFGFHGNSVDLSVINESLRPEKPQPQPNYNNPRRVGQRN